MSINVGAILYIFFLFLFPHFNRSQYLHSLLIYSFYTSFLFTSWSSIISIIVDALDSKFSDESDEMADEGISGPERAYRGPHLTFPLQKKDIDTLIELFRKKKVLN